jgi:hypothetical protein
MFGFTTSSLSAPLDSFHLTRTDFRFLMLGQNIRRSNFLKAALEHLELHKRDFKLTLFYSLRRVLLISDIIN